MQPFESDGSPLSVHRAFVVQFRAGTGAAHGSVSGRIEHVASRQTGSFGSWAEMREFMARILARTPSKPLNPDR